MSLSADEARTQLGLKDYIKENADRMVSDPGSAGEKEATIEEAAKNTLGKEK